MAENNAQESFPHKSLDELVEFFDSRDMGDYLEGMPEVEFTVALRSKRHLVAIDEEVASQLTEIAKVEMVSAEALVNSWLKERISHYTEEPKLARQ